MNGLGLQMPRTVAPPAAQTHTTLPRTAKSASQMDISTTQRVSQDEGNANMDIPLHFLDPEPHVRLYQNQDMESGMHTGRAIPTTSRLVISRRWKLRHDV